MASKYSSWVQKDSMQQPQQGSAHGAAADPSSGFPKEAGVRLSCSSPGNTDRKRTGRDLNNSCPFPLHARLGRTNNPCFSSHLFPISGRRFRQGIPARILCPAQHVAPQHPSPPLPPLLSRAHLLQIIFPNFTPSSAEFTGVPRRAPSAAGTQP